MIPEEQAVIEAAEDYYWHGDESVDFHNDLMEAVEALHKARSEQVNSKAPAE